MKALSVPCPKCGAGVGMPCMRGNTKGKAAVHRDPHPWRRFLVGDMQPPHGASKLRKLGV